MLSDNAGMGGKTLSQTQQINGHKRRFREIALGAISIPLLPCLVLFPLVAFPFLPLFISPFLTLFLFCLSVSRPPFPVNPTFGSVELIILVKVHGIVSVSGSCPYFWFSNACEGEINGVTSTRLPPWGRWPPSSQWID